LVEPDGGEVRLFGTGVSARDPRGLKRLRARVGFVFQHHNLVGRATALSNVIHGCLARESWITTFNQAVAPNRLRGRAMACLERVGLADLAGQRADLLSGGQSQRVAVARALMQEPELLIADEPAASLDPAAGEEVMTLFADLARRDGLSLLFTTHNLQHARQYARRIVGLRAGSVVLDRPVAEMAAASLDDLYT
jgi:phosphonate transport system ATP-binding protein